MNSTIPQAAPSIASRPRFAAPIWTLLLLSPFIAEVLSGSTRATVLFVYVPEIDAKSHFGRLMTDCVDPDNGASHQVGIAQVPGQ